MSRRSGRGWTSIADAVANDLAFCVDPREGLIVIDCDYSEGDHFPNEAIDALRNTGANVVRVASGRATNEHVFVNGFVGWSTSDLVEVAASHGVPRSKIRRDGADIRPPLSRHPAGGRGSLVDPGDAHKALEMLKSRPGAVPLQDKWPRVLRTGSLPGKPDASRSSVIMAYAIACANAGLDSVAFCADIRGSVVLSQKVNEKGAKGQEWLDATWRRALALVKTSPPRPSTPDLAALRVTAQGHPWRGASGDTDRRVYCALVELSSMAGNPVACDQRRLAEKVGVERKTVARAIRRLVDAGLVTRESDGSGRQAATYRLHPKADVRDPNMYLCGPISEVSIGVTSSDFDSELPDAFQGRSGLPRSAYATFCALPEDGSSATVAEIVARRPGALGSSTVRQHLRAMLSVGDLVDRNAPTGHRWRRVPEPNVQRAAISLGAAGSNELRRERHERERILHAHGLRAISSTAA